MNRSLKYKNTLLYKYSNLIFLLIGVFAFVILSFINDNDEKVVKSVDGILDLTEWDFQKKSIYTLKGEWTFYWQQLPYDSLGDFNPKVLKYESKTIVKVRETWKKAGFSSKGFGTYRMQIKLPKSSEEYGFKTFRLKSACEVWVNGSKVESLGKMGNTESRSIPDGRPLFFKLPKAGTVDLVMPVSNFRDGRGGGTSHTIQIGSYNTLQRARVLKIIESASGMAIGLAMAIFQFILYLFKRRKTSLYISLFCSAVLIRIICIDEVILYYYWSELPFWFLLKARYFSFYCFVVFLALYYRELLPNYFKKWFVQIVVYLFSIGAIYVLVAPSYWVTLTGFIFNILTLIAAISVVYVMIRLVFSEEALHKLIFLSLMFVFFLSVNDTLHLKGVIDTGDSGMWSIGLLVYLGIQTIISYKFQGEVEAENRLMELEVYQKETMLKEVHHRVKNNFQIITGLLEMQANEITDKDALAIIDEGKNRMKSMSFVHQKLYQNDDNEIDFEEYIKLILMETSSMFSSEKIINTKVVSNGIRFDVDTAIPLGLIINELVTNAYKYAFQKEKDNELLVELNKAGSGQYILVVSDNGNGLDTTIDLSKTESLGLRLVRRLTKQLHGTLKQSNNNGARFEIIFKDTSSRKETD